MVWIFGGAYSEGGGSSKHNDGENLAKKGVVLVTFNYRLGPFGFFTHPELTEGVRPERVGQSGAGRQHRRAAVGEDEYRRVRRRSEQRHDLR